MFACTHCAELRLKQHQEKREALQRRVVAPISTIAASNTSAQDGGEVGEDEGIVENISPVKQV